MLRKIVLLSFILLAKNASAQYLKLDNGIILSSFNNEKNLEILSEKKYVSYMGSIGLDYLEKKWFNLSSQVGYTKIGGEDKSSIPGGTSSKISENRGMAHINTTFRSNLKSGNSRVFLGVGPYANILLGSREFTNSDTYPYTYKRINAGGRAEIGFIQDINKVRIGLLGTYMVGLSPVASTEFLALKNNGFGAQVSIGYRVQ